MCNAWWSHIADSKNTALLSHLCVRRCRVCACVRVCMCVQAWHLLCGRCLGGIFQMRRASGIKDQSFLGENLADIQIFCHLCSIWECEWEQLLATYGNLWQLMATYGNLWQLMATYGNFWQVMATYGNFWQLMATFGNLWQNVATYGNVLLLFIIF